MDRRIAAIAGLLYDIGRLAQLAQPSAQGTDATARSEAFIRQHVPADLLSSGWQDVLRTAVGLADWLVAGGDVGQSQPQPRTLLSVFCQIGDDPAKRPKRAYLSLRPLALDEATLFPSAEVRGDAAAYASLWQGLQDAAAKLQGQADAEAYIESLYHVLRRYTWCVPSAAEGVSLFDHSRVRAALAVCLADLGEAEIQNLLQRPDDASRPLAYLVKGDVSGVQRFIYTLTSKGVAKGLRGRSFYLQLLNEAIARYILREMELPVTNLIYVGGGHFYLLVPPVGEGRLLEIRRGLEDLLLKHHDGALYLALGHAELRAADFRADRFSAKWREAGGSVAEAKRRRFAHVPDLFEPRGHGGNEETECQVCHAERRDIARDEEVRKCALCRSFEDLGGALGRSQVLALGQITPVQQQRGRYEALLAELGFKVALLDEEVEKRLGDWVGVTRVTVLGLRDFPAAQLCERVARALRCPVAAGVRYTANVTPRKGQYEVATFEDLQDASTGLKRLGVLRMDVDDLGYLFGHGFQGKENGKERHLTTLARVAGLSSMMALFFEGWVGELCRRINEENSDRKTDVLYTIYSGGDDLFIVGAWDVLPGLAKTIRDDLGRFAADNPYVHVSAGITLHGGKYPLYLAAADAAEALESAKDVPGKDALTFLGESHPWQDWKKVDDYKNELHGLVEVRQVGRSLLQVLQRMYAQYCDVRDALAERGGLRARNGRDQTVWGPYMWQSAYLLTRLAERVNGEVKERVRNLRDRLSADNFRAIETVGLAARWAEALTKRERTR